MKPVYRQAFLAAACSLSLGACDRLDPADNDQTPAIGLRAPAALVTSRAVDVPTLYPHVELIDPDGTRIVIDMRRGTDEQWSGNTRLQAGTLYRLAVTWHQSVNGRDLLLASHVQAIDSGTSGTRLTLANDDYDFNADADGDGASNLQELEAGSDPFTADAVIVSEPAIDSLSTDEPQAMAEDTTGKSDGESDDESIDAGRIAGTPVAPESTTETNSAAGTSTGTVASAADRGTSSGTEVTDVTEAVVAPGWQDDSATTRPAAENMTGDAIPAVLIPRVSPDAAPVLDGLVGAEIDALNRLPGEWGEAVQTDASGALLGVNRLLIDNRAEAADGTPYRRWAGVHDGQYLYLLVLVDDLGRRKSDSADARDDDSVELFIDKRPTGLSDGSDPDGWHLILPLLPQHDSSPNSDAGRYQATAGSRSERPVFSFMTGPGVGPDGIRQWRWEQDVYEIRIPLDSAGLAPGALFGLEIQVNDDDNGGARDSTWGWATPTGTPGERAAASAGLSRLATVQLAP